MLEVYTLNATAAAGASFPLASVSLQKGASALLVGAGSIQLNKCGVYMVAVDASSTANTTIQLAKNGVLQPQAQSVGTSPSFVTLVQVPNNNTNCCCSEPTVITIVNPTTAEETETNLHVVVTKVC